jgi:cobalt-zinc-cadmium efflux system protein
VNVAALVLFVVYLLLGFVARTWLQWRRTGDGGFRGISGRLGSPEWVAGVSFVVALLAGVLGPVTALAGLDPLTVLDMTGLRWAGAVLAVTGVVATLAVQLQMGASWRIGVDAGERTDLVTSGTFALVRNPIFTVMAVTGLGLALMTPNVVALAGFVVLLVALQLQVRVVEEPYLLRTHGATYAAYAASTGRFVPGLGRLPRAAEPAAGSPAGLMGSGHSHAPAGHAGGKHRWRLAVAFGLVAAFFVVELVFGLLSGSLALLSDAGHMAADVVALGAALVATRIPTRRDTTGRRTYGSYRAEVFASGLAVLLMLGVAVYVVVEAIGRIGETVEVETGPMLVVGGLGLAVNVVAMVLLRGGAAESLNVKGAYLEVVADTAGSVGVIAAGILVAATGQAYWDTVVALAIGAFVAVRAVMLGREVLAVLGQHVPAGMEVDDVTADLEAIAGVADVHDLHVWTLTSGMHVATAHLVAADTATAPTVLAEARRVLRVDHGIEHATLQVETASDRGCQELDW